LEWASKTIFQEQESQGGANQDQKGKGEKRKIGRKGPDIAMLLPLPRLLLLLFILNDILDRRPQAGRMLRSDWRAVEFDYVCVQYRRRTLLRSFVCSYVNA
jgi:hypothetical protein